MLEELIEAVEMMDGRGLHQTDHARSKPWRCCYVPVIVPGVPGRKSRATSSSQHLPPHVTRGEYSRVT